MPPDPTASARKPDFKDPLVGAVINGKYRVVDVLASGGMGRIYRAEQEPLGREVALKVLRTRYADADAAVDEQFRRRFFREASILAKLQHANIVTLHDYGRIEGAEPEQYFMAMELLRGETLAQRIRSRGALDVREVLPIVRQVARGLREAHRAGAIHRDLKPSNLMLVPEEDGHEVAKILDFGIGKMIGTDEDSQELTQQGAFLGSPKYIAPEQVAERAVDVRTDVYSLGVIAYECLTGLVPFEGATNLETILAHCNSPVPAMNVRTPGLAVPPALEAMVRRCLAKDPEMRPASMEELLRELADLERDLFGAHSGASGVSSAPRSGGSTPGGGTRRGPEDDTLTSSPGGDPSIEAGLKRASIGTQGSLSVEQQTKEGKASRRTMVLVAAGGAVLVVVLAIAGVRLATGSAKSATSAASAAAAPASSAVPNAGGDRGSFTLVLESTPTGAEVVEDDNVLGTTPMQLPIDRGTVLKEPRRFVLRYEGYAPYTLLQGNSDAGVRVGAQLVAAPSSSAKPAKPQSPTTAQPGGPKPPPTHAPTGSPDLDIKLKR
jgi:serine/threonine-protein kinase